LKPIELDVIQSASSAERSRENSKKVRDELADCYFDEFLFPPRKISEEIGALTAETLLRRVLCVVKHLWLLNRVIKSQNGSTYEGNEKAKVLTENFLFSSNSTSMCHLRVPEETYLKMSFDGYHSKKSLN
jgi:hypothetical protein